MNKYTIVLKSNTEPEVTVEFRGVVCQSQELAIVAIPHMLGQSHLWYLVSIERTE